MLPDDIKSELERARDFANAGNWAGVDQILNEIRKKGISEELYRNEVKDIYKILSQKMIEKCELDVQKIDESRFGWEYAWVIEMVEEAVEYAKMAEIEIPKLSEKTMGVMKLVYDKFIFLDLTKAKNYRERNDKSLALSYAKMAKEILERANGLNIYSLEEIKKKTEEIDGMITNIDKSD